jgi:hypothetical protein
MTSVRRAMILPALLVAAGILTECSQLVDPRLPPDSTPFSAPGIYARWWAMTEACSGTSGSLAAVSWFETTSILTDPRTGALINGYWSAASNRIVLSRDARLNGGIVRHEMLHALIREPSHSRAQFLGRCAGVVTCSTACIDDAGPPPPRDPAAIQVPPESLTLGLTVDPTAPSAAQDGGFFTITVTATNPSSRPVVVGFPPPIWPPRTFGFDVRGAAAAIIDGVVELDPSMSAFAAGEMKRQVFDFAIGSEPLARALPLGTYTILGSYGGNEAGPVSLVLR